MGQKIVVPWICFRKLARLQAVLKFAQKHRYDIVQQERWSPVGALESVFEAERLGFGCTARFMSCAACFANANVVLKTNQRCFI